MWGGRGGRGGDGDLCAQTLNLLINQPFRVDIDLSGQ